MTYSRLLSRTLPCVLATAALGAACSRADFDPIPDAGGDPPDAGSIVSDGGPDGGHVDAGPPAPVLCDGSVKIRLAYQVAGGGPVFPASQVLSENGFTYLLIDGTCHYWVLRDVYQEVREGDLSPQQAASLAADLRLGMWSGLPPAGPLCPDAPAAILRFEDQRYQLPGCGSPDAGTAVSLAAHVRDHVEKLHAAGLPVSGSARYVLVTQDGDWSAAVQAQAAPWQVTVPAASVALTTAQAYMYQRGSSSVATGADAASLRSIRNASVSTNVRMLTGGYLPVVGETGARYQLYVRDAIPPEDPQGLLPLL